MCLHKKRREHEDGERYVRQCPDLGDGEPPDGVISRLRLDMAQRIAGGMDDELKENIGGKSNNSG